MKSRIASVLVVAATLLAGAASAASTDKRQTVRLDRDAIVDGIVVPAGTYRVDVAAGLDTARFVQGKRTVAEARCKVGLAQAVYPGTAVHYRTGDGDHDRLIKIVFAGANLAVEFDTGSGGKSDASFANAADGR